MFLVISLFVTAGFLKGNPAFKWLILQVSDWLSETVKNAIYSEAPRGEQDDTLGKSGYRFTQ